MFDQTQLWTAEREIFKVKNISNLHSHEVSFKITNIVTSNIVSISDRVKEHKTGTPVKNWLVNPREASNHEIFVLCWF